MPVILNGNYMKYLIVQFRQAVGILVEPKQSDISILGKVCYSLPSEQWRRRHEVPSSEQRRRRRRKHKHVPRVTHEVMPSMYLVITCSPTTFM
ncbi:cys-loop ligand-gated ion channel-like X3 [Biomphalaria pfeifferi]|uniref:Cys-loop ligand-gated ion channel-like X3 n=1 Tax=Biomphalaria pfeifferi TaxID=112525 RepID=A0AAD8AST1_BIOPF|nr:cys-loop ligand-gated ion channel-like X3 [Biomphalaria pfeifferi]